MKCAIIAVFALVMAVNAKPYEYGGIPQMGHQSLTQMGQMGQSGFNKNQHGFGAANFHAGGAATQYDRGTEEKEFSSVVHSNQKSSHDRGSSQQFGVGSSSMGGYEDQSAGFSGFANGLLHSANTLIGGVH